MAEGKGMVGGEGMGSGGISNVGILDRNEVDRRVSRAVLAKARAGCCAILCKA
jgi:hypothetical protein